MRELHLRTHWDQTASQMIVIFPEQIDGQEHVIDVVEYQSMLIGILLLLREKCYRVLTPMAEGVEMVRGVVAIIVAVAVALLLVS